MPTAWLSLGRWLLWMIRNIWSRSRQVNREGLNQLQEGFLAMGLSFVPSSANFVLVKVGQGKEGFQALQRQGIIVRPMEGYQLLSWVRVSVGTQAQNQSFWKNSAAFWEDPHNVAETAFATQKPPCIVS